MTPPVLSILFHFISLLNNFWIVLIPCLSIYFPQSKDIKYIYTCVFYWKVNVCSHGFLISLHVNVSTFTVEQITVLNDCASHQTLCDSRQEIYIFI